MFICQFVPLSVMTIPRPYVTRWYDDFIPVTFIPPVAMHLVN